MKRFIIMIIIISIVIGIIIIIIINITNIMLLWLLSAKYLICLLFNLLFKRLF